MSKSSLYWKSPKLTFVFFQAQRWHVGNESFGRQWQCGDVVGCMIDLTEMNIMFTLNGEMLISDSGSEMAFKDIEIGEGKYNNNSFLIRFPRERNLRY